MQGGPQHEDHDHTCHASDQRLCCCTDWQPGGALPAGPSARCPEGQCLTPSGEMKPYVTPRALSRQEVLQVIADYARAAENAMAAGVPCACLLVLQAQMWSISTASVCHIPQCTSVLVMVPWQGLMAVRSTAPMATCLSSF